VRGVVELKQVFLDPGSQATMDQAIAHARANNFYKALQCMRRVLPYEELVMQNPAYQHRRPDPVGQTNAA
jgi:hypothetical protein